jgi:ribonuclease P protein component
VFSQRERLPRSQFETVLKAGGRVSSPNFTIVFSKKTKGYGVIVSKKTIRLSVRRHRLKRQIFEIMRTYHPPCAAVVIPRPAVYGVSYADMESELRALFAKIPQ